MNRNVSNQQVDVYTDNATAKSTNKLFMVNSQGLILHKTRHKGGRQHDYHLYKHNHPVTPSQVESIFD
ncbi:MAG: hypothetical protein WA323_22140, partial [Candidatus Nitrosopolaris sp.]